MSNSGLGRGLDSLMPEADETQSESGLHQLPVDLITPNPDQPRQNFNSEKMEELTDSIAEQGLIEPLLVRPKATEGYVLVAGERRWRAARQAGLEEVPAIVREFSDEEALAVSLVENIQRENLNPLEESRAYKQLMEKQDCGQQEVAQAVGKSRSAVANRLRLLELPETAREALEAEEISAGHARVLLGLEAAAAGKVVEQIKQKQLNVRQTEKLVTKLKESETEETETKTGKPEPAAHFEDLEAELEESIGAPVNIKSSDRKSGQIRIQFNNPDEFELIKDRLKEIEI